MCQCSSPRPVPRTLSTLGNGPSSARSVGAPSPPRAT
ncbi:hypothetical protein LEMLEM_LOCUS7814 [Lemmus lemmus]